MPEIIYGLHPVLETIYAGRSIDKILIANETKGAKVLKVVSIAKKNKIPVEYTSKQLLFEIAKTLKTQGVIAIVRSHNYSTVEDILNKSENQNEAPLIAILDGIEDPHNLGAIIRTADGAGVHGVILPTRRSVGVTATVAKTSAGASSHVLTAMVSNLNYIIEELKSKNIWIVGADQNVEQTYHDLDLSGALGIVIGAEGHGLHRLVREKCDFLVNIPMFGKVNSLNASVAAALLFFEARRQRELSKR